MIRRESKCRDAANDLPGGLQIGSMINSGNNECAIPTGQAVKHLVEVQNRTLLRFSIEITAESESEGLYYGDHERNWETILQIGHRTSGGGPRRRSVGQDLISDKMSTDSSVKVNVKYTALGCLCEGRSVIQLQVDTVEAPSATS